MTDSPMAIFLHEVVVGCPKKASDADILKRKVSISSSSLLRGLGVVCSDSVSFTVVIDCVWATEEMLARQEMMTRDHEMK